MRTPTTASRLSFGKAILFEPEDPLKPPGKVFDEPWQAQVLAMADAMVRAGHFSARSWAERLGAELSRAEKAGKPDTAETYYAAALTALEELLSASDLISPEDRNARKSEWTKAYRSTPHGEPVLLQPK